MQSAITIGTIGTVGTQTDEQVEFRHLSVDRGTETGNQEVVTSDAYNF